MTDPQSHPPRQSAAGLPDECSATPPPDEVQDAGTEGTVDPALETLALLLRRSVEPEPYSSEPACQQAIDVIAAIGRDPSGGKSPAARPDDSFQPRDFGQYRLLGKLGAGGMGTVYKALHKRLEKVVALKMLPADRMRDESAVARFEREIQIIGKLEHPNIVAAHDAGETDGIHYLVMELVDGIDLSALVKCIGPLPVAEACEIIRQAALGLEHAHQHGMVHRDIKPSNLMLTPDGRVKILDMGLALLQEKAGQPGQELTSAGQMMGTFEYMAPEQGSDSHEVDSRADIYSLGATLYKLLSGHAPLGGEQCKTPYQRLMALANDEPEPITECRADLPEGLAEVVHHMLAHHPEQRFGGSAEVAAALEPFCSGGNLPELLDRVELVNIHGGASIDSQLDTLPSALANDATPTEIESNQSVAFLEGTVQLTHQRRAVPRPVDPLPKAKWRRAVRVLVGLALLLCGAATVIAISNRDGLLIIETDDPNVELALKQDGRVVKIADADSGWKLKLGPGRYDVELREGADRLSLSARRITLHQGQETVLEVERRTVVPPATDEPATAPRAVPYVDRGWVRFVNRHSGRAMSIHQASLEEGKSLRQHALAPGAAQQQWRIESTKQPGWYRLRNRRSGLYVKLLEPKLGQGFIQRPLKEAGDEFLFSIEESSAGHVKIVSKATELCMSIWGGETREDQWIIQWAYAKAATDHHWRVEPVDPDEAFAKATDLLPLIDPAKHAVEGTWRKEGKDLVIRKPKGEARVFAPLRVEGSYRLRVEFTRTAGDHDINVILPIGRRQCRLLLSGWWGGHNGLHLVDGREAKDNSTRFAYQFTNGRCYLLDLTVETAGETATVLAEIDDEPVLRFSGKAERLSIDRRWSLPEPGQVGLGTQCDMRFHVAKLVMTSGKAAEEIAPTASLPLAAPDGVRKPTAEMPAGWVEPGAFARIKGKGQVTFPAVAMASYVLEMKMTFHNPQGRVDCRIGEPGALTEIGFGARWPQDKDTPTVPCRLFNVHFAWFHWKGERQLPVDEMVALKLIVCEDEKYLFLEGERILGANGTPADFHLTISAGDKADVTIHECSCRALNAEDAKLAGREMPVLQIKADVNKTAARLEDQLAKDLADKPQDGKPFRVATTGSVMRWVAPGEFRMGSPDAEQDRWGRGSERVRISRGYWIGQYELTQGEWEKVKKQNPSRVTGSPYLPVNWLNWEEAQLFCRELTGRERTAGRLPKGYEYRLPTEAEWEHACRAGGDEPFPVPKDKFNWRGNKARSVLEVGSTPPNARGLYDMLGNVPEWCLDEWHSYPKKQEQATVDRYHAGDPAKSRFAVRGGGFWDREERSVSCHARQQGINHPSGYRGFRLALAPNLSVRSDQATEPKKAEQKPVARPAGGQPKASDDASHKPSEADNK